MVRRQQFRQKIEGRNGGNTDVQQLLIFIGKFQNRFLLEIQDLGCVVVKGLPCGRDRQTLGRSLQKLRMKFFFQIVDMRTDGRLRKIKLLSRKGKTLVFYGIHKGFQLADIHAALLFVLKRLFSSIIIQFIDYINKYIRIINKINFT